MTSRTEPSRAARSAPYGTSKGTPALAERPLGADDALGDGRLRGQERAGDLLGGQAAEQPQGEGDPGLRRQHRVAGGEDQPQQVVVDVVGSAGSPVGGGTSSRVAPDLGQLAGVRLLAAYEVDRAVLGGGHEPGARLVRDARLRPLLQRGDQGVLRELLGDADVPHDAGDTGDDPRGLDPEYRFDRFGRACCRHGHPSEQPRSRQARASGRPGRIRLSPRRSRGPRQVTVQCPRGSPGTAWSTPGPRPCPCTG